MVEGGAWEVRLCWGLWGLGVVRSQLSVLSWKRDEFGGQERGGRGLEVAENATFDYLSYLDGCFGDLSHIEIATDENSVCRY